jgi:DNA-binding GntR family transcriptional regulator
MTHDTKKPRRMVRRVLREEIREQLIDDILSGRLAPGTRIVETRLAQELGVSQAPVREALRDLELFGFVVSSPFRGTQVRKISREDLLEIYPVRAVLEGVAARAAATRIDEATLAQLEELIGAMRAAATRNDHRAHVDADFAFHHAIVKASGNRMLQHVWQTMRLATTTFVTHSMTQLTHRSLHEIGERHVPVLEALRARDPVVAEAAMRRHIEEPGDWIRDAVALENAAKDLAAAGQAQAEEEAAV